MVTFQVHQVLMHLHGRTEIILMVWIGIHFSKKVFNMQLTHYQCFLLRFIDKKVHNSA